MTTRRVKCQPFELGLLGCLGLLLLTSACSQPTPPDTRGTDEATLRDVDARWSKTAESRDLDHTVSYYADDATVLAPNAPMASDKPAIRALWASLLVPGTSIAWQATKVEVARSSDLGYVMGTYQLNTKGPQGRDIADHGKFVEVWKKQADGNWKVVADIFNTDLPMPMPPAETTK
jgi:ketosteroid isomerase-like protein